MKHWRSEHPGHTRRYVVKCVYGLEPTAFDAMLAKQGNACAICRTSFEERRLTIDHCHNTGKVRGLLCASCNSGIAYLDDNPAVMRAAARYVAKHQ